MKNNFSTNAEACNSAKRSIIWANYCKTEEDSGKLLSLKEHVLHFSWCERDTCPRMKECFFSPDLLCQKRFSNLVTWRGTSPCWITLRSIIAKKLMFLSMLLIVQIALAKMAFLLFKNQNNGLLSLILEQQNIWEVSWSWLPENPTPRNSSAEAGAPGALLNARTVGIMKSHLTLYCK